MKTKYILELTETQAQALATALESFVRLGITQYGAAIDMALPGDLLPGHKPELEGAFNTIKKVIHGLNPNQGLSILNSTEVSEPVKIAHDAYEVIRYRLSWDKHPEGGSTVNFSEPLRASKTEELPVFRKV